MLDCSEATGRIGQFFRGRRPVASRSVGSSGLIGGGQLRNRLAHFRAIRGVTFGVTYSEGIRRLSRIIVMARVFESLSRQAYQQNIFEPQSRSDSLLGSNPRHKTSRVRQLGRPAKLIARRATPEGRGAQRRVIPQPAQQNINKCIMLYNFINLISNQS